MLKKLALVISLVIILPMILITCGKSVEPVDQETINAQKAVARILKESKDLGDGPDSLKAEEYSIAVTFDGSSPSPEADDYTITMPTSGPAFLDYALPGQNHGVTVKVILQTRRDVGGGSYIYSENTTDIQTILADAEGPSAPPYVDTHRGPIGAF